MGSPLSATVLEKLEEYIFDTFYPNITFFKRYVNECLCASPENKINNVLNMFNSYHPRLQCTLEIEKNNQIKK